ncbi:hypothetical protein NF212_13150 [Parasalinivibrio latis]|uniref:hypothetical protein n=1 Tax=Parasalinivibrio latis TaxID=2952610 RepID=UPI0030E450FC
MTAKLYEALSQLDQKLLQIIDSENIDDNQLSELLSEREELIQKIQCSPTTDFDMWQDATERTKFLLSRFTTIRDEAGKEAGKLVRGRRSVEIYKKFQ